LRKVCGIENFFPVLIAESAASDHEFGHGWCLSYRDTRCRKQDNDLVSP
jgi:hypothetical protein